jgi:hypothetical protein
MQLLGVHSTEAGVGSEQRTWGVGACQTATTTRYQGLHFRAASGTDASCDARVVLAVAWSAARMSRCTSAMATRAGQSTAWLSLFRALVP